MPRKKTILAGLKGLRKGENKVCELEETLKGSLYHEADHL